MSLATLALLAAALPATAAAQADLTVTDVSFTPAAPTGGEAVKVIATVRSAAAASEDFYVTFLVGNTTLGRTLVASAAADEDVRVESPVWISTEGVRNFTVIADSTKLINETDEKNNNATASLTVGNHVPAPDLLATQVALSPSRPRPGQSVMFTITLTNGGDEVTGPFNTTLRIDGQLLDPPLTVSDLAPGKTFSASRGPWAANNGTHVLRAEVDVDGDVAESNEWNNLRNFTLVVSSSGTSGQSGPDLVVDELAASPSSPDVGATVTLTAKVRNAGDEAAANSKVAFRDGSTTLATLDIGALGPGVSGSVSTTWTAKSGTHTLRALADVADDVEESDETNNEQSRTLTPDVPRPDLHIDATVAAPAAPSAGDAVTFTATVANRGGAPAGGFDVAFTVNGQGIGTAHVDGLPAGASTSVASQPWTAPQGTHTVTVRADSGRRIAEAEEDDNTATLTLVVPAAQPFAMTALSIANPPATEGTPLGFVATVKGTALSAGQSVHVVFIIDGQPLGELDAVADASGLASATSPPWTPTAGSHTLTAIAKLAGQADVSRSLPFEAQPGSPGSTPTPVQPPPLATGANLRMEGVGLVDPGAPLGAAMPLVAALRNDGAGDAGPFEVDFFVDRVYLGSVRVDGLAAGAATNVSSPPWSVRSGSHEFQAVADSTHQVAETVETDNGASAPFTQGAAPPSGTGATTSTPMNPIPGIEVGFAVAVAFAAALARRRLRP